MRKSLIKHYFNEDTYMEILKITFLSNVDNNGKGLLIKDILRKNGIPFNGLGSGTNRLGVNIDGYAFKIALDKDGMIDNRREFIYSKKLQPYVIKVYECIPNGLIAVTEKVEPFNMRDFNKFQDKMKEILYDISRNYLLGDCGITTKNYINWGKRYTSDKDICILDFAYIYDVKFNIFNCTCDESSLLVYDDNFVNLYCPYCGKKYSFADLRKRISKEKQEEEIGDISRTGYKLTSDEQEVRFNKDYEYIDYIEEEEEQKRLEKKKQKKEEKELRKKIMKRVNSK